MNKNMGVVDRIVRLVLAVVIVALYATNQISGALGIILVILAVVFVLTSAVGFCPLYAPFKISTRARSAS